ncbi:glycosyltransferase [Dokdonella sp. MW10]|uniref:glycosyltransferase n=1 Tax=Dokdonella sp. MW10 TaxID=2992926 RepID=UPI003F812D60
MRGTALVILAWNQWPLTRRCLDSVLATDLAHAEIIVVDNGSTDETREALAAYADRVRIIGLPENLGFVRGMNTGIAAARRHDDVVLLNNDLVIRQRDWLERLRDAAYAAPDHGVVGCRLLEAEPGRRLMHTGGFIEPEQLWGQQSESGQMELDVGQYLRTRRVQGIAFAVAYLRRDCLDRVGTLDEAFHSYYEDTDYCLRAADAGVATVVAGAVTVHHDQHGSTKDDGGFRKGLWARSRATFASRWQQRLIDAYRGDGLWHGVTRASHVHAQLSRMLVRRLDARGLRMAFEPAMHELADVSDFRIAVAAARSMPALPDVAFACAPGAPRAARGRHRTALAFSEWDAVPPDWVAGANGIDRLIVPDIDQRDLLRRSGVTTAIDVVRFGVDIDYAHPHVPAMPHPAGAFTWMAVVEDWHRDAPDVLVTAFRRAFHADDAVELVVYIRPGDDEMTILDRLRPLVEPREGGRTRLMAGWNFHDYEWPKLLAHADAYVSARRGGGWDIHAHEAVAAGRILVAPAYGSQRELVERWGVEVATTPADATGTHGLRWRESDAEALEATLKSVHVQRYGLKALARRRAADFAARHDIDATADAIIALAGSGAGIGLPAARPRAHHPADAAQPGGQIVVLGMHRSGTSSIGGLLHLFGAWAGPDDALLKGPDNPKGHFEHGELHMACVRRLATAGGDWRTPPDESPPAAIDAFRREAAAVLDTLEPRRPWFIKEPRLCLLARELLPLLTHPVFVHVVREPTAVARSLAQRDAMSAGHATALWERYTRDAFDTTRGWRRIVVDYDALVAAPVATARAMFDALVEAGVKGLSMPDDDTILAWIEPGRAHAGASIDDIAFTASQAALRDAIADRSILDRDATA